MKKGLEKRLDGVYTRLLMRAQDVSWKDHHTVADMYRNITPTSRRQHWFVGHCFCNKKLIISDLILWKLLSHRKGKRPLNYIDAVSHDTSSGYEELTTATGESIHISVSSTQKRFSPVNVKQQSR